MIDENLNDVERIHYILKKGFDSQKLAFIKNLRFIKDNSVCLTAAMQDIIVKFIYIREILKYGIKSYKKYLH